MCTYYFIINSTHKFIEKEKQKIHIQKWTRDYITYLKLQTTCVLITSLSTPHICLRYSNNAQPCEVITNYKTNYSVYFYTLCTKPFHTTMVVLFMTYSAYNKRYLLLHYQLHIYVRERETNKSAKATRDNNNVYYT